MVLASWLLTARFVLCASFFFSLPTAPTEGHPVGFSYSCEKGDGDHHLEDRRSGVDDTPSMVDGYREGITVCVDEGDQVIIVLIRKCTSPIADAVP